MTREELINVIYNRADKSTCPIYCPEYTGRDNCTKCAEKLLAEYEKQIRAEIIDELMAFIDDVDMDSDYIYLKVDREKFNYPCIPYKSELGKYITEQLKGE